MTPSRKSQSSPRNKTQTLLTTLKLTTTIGAVSLTLTGWALLSRVEAINAANSVPAASAAFSINAGSTRALASSPSMTADARPETVANADVSRAIAVATATSAPPTATPLSSVAVSGAGASPTASSTTPPTASPTTSPTATPTTAPTATPQPKFKLNIVQWVKTNAGDPVAVVRDNRGILWYVWGADVPRIEQGLRPQYQPQPVNRVGRTRRS